MMNIIYSLKYFSSLVAKRKPLNNGMTGVRKWKRGDKIGNEKIN